MPILKKIYSNYKKEENENNKSNEKGYVSSSDNSYTLRRNNKKIKNSAKLNSYLSINSNNKCSNKNKFIKINKELEIENFEMLENIEKYDSDEKYYSENFMDNGPNYIFENLKNMKKSELRKKKNLMEKNKLINPKNYFHSTYKNFKIKNKIIKNCNEIDMHLTDSSKSSLNYLNSSKFIDIFRRKKVAPKFCFSSFINDNDKYKIKNFCKNKISIDNKKRKSIKIRNKLKEDLEYCKNIIDHTSRSNSLEISEATNNKIDDSLDTLNVYKKNYLCGFKFINENHSGLNRRKKISMKISKLLELRKERKNKQNLFERKKVFLNEKEKYTEKEDEITKKSKVKEKESVFIKLLEEKNENLNNNELEFDYRENTKKREMNSCNISLINYENNVNDSLYLKSNSVVDNSIKTNKNEEIYSTDYKKEDLAFNEHSKKVISEMDLSNDNNFILSLNSRNYEEPIYGYCDEKEKESSTIKKHENYLNEINFENKEKYIAVDIKKLSENSSMKPNNDMNVSSNTKYLIESNEDNNYMDGKKNNQLDMNENFINDSIIDSYINNNSEDITSENYKIFEFDNFSIRDSFKTLIKNCDNILKNTIRNNLSDFSESNIKLDSNCEFDISIATNEHGVYLNEINNLKKSNFLDEKNELIKKSCSIQNNPSNKEDCTIIEADLTKRDLPENLDNFHNICNKKTNSTEERNYYNKKCDSLGRYNKSVNNPNSYCKKNDGILKMKGESDTYVNNEIDKEINLNKYSDNEQKKCNLNIMPSCINSKNESTVEGLHKNKNKDKEGHKRIFHFNSSFANLVTSNCLRNLCKKYCIKIKKKKVKNKTVIYLHIPTTKNRVSNLNKRKKKTKSKKLNFQNEKKDTVYKGKLKKKNNLSNHKNYIKNKNYIKKFNILKHSEYYNTDKRYKKLNIKYFTQKFKEERFTECNTYNKNGEVSNNNMNYIYNINKNSYPDNVKYNNDGNILQNKKEEHNVKFCKVTINNCSLNEEAPINSNSNNNTSSPNNSNNSSNNNSNNNTNTNINATNNNTTATNNNNVNKVNNSFRESDDNNNNKNNFHNNESDINKNCEINKSGNDKENGSSIKYICNNKDSKNYNKVFNVILKFLNENENIKNESFKQKLNRNEKSYNSEYIRMEKMIHNIMSINKENKKSSEFTTKSNKNNCESSHNTRNSKKKNIAENEHKKISYNNDDNKIICLNNYISKNENNKINIPLEMKKLVEKIKLKKNKENAFIYLYGHKNMKFGEFCIEFQTLEENCKLFQKLNLNEKKKLTIKKEELIKNYYNNLCMNEKNEKIYKIISNSFSVENFLIFLTLIKIKNKMNVFLNEISDIMLEINNLIIYIEKKLLEIRNLMYKFESIKNRKKSSKFILIKKFMNFFLNITNIYSDICTKIKSQSSIFSFVQFNYEIINNYLLFIKKFSNYISYSAMEIQNCYNKIKNVNRNIKGIYLSNEQKDLFRNIHNNLIDHLKNNYEKIIIFKKILDIYLIELKNFKKYQKEYTFNKVNILISSKCPYDLLLFSIIIRCKNLCEISIRNICNNFDFNNFQKEKNFYFFFLNKKIKNNFLKKIKKIVREDIFNELKKIIFYKELNCLVSSSIYKNIEENNKMNGDYQNNSETKVYNEYLISYCEDNKTNLEKKNEPKKIQKDTKMKKSKWEKKGNIEKNDIFASNITTNNLSTCSSLNNCENIKYLENIDQILKTNNTLSLVKNIRKSLNINTYSENNDSSEKRENMNSLTNMKNKIINAKCDVSKNMILASLKKKELLNNEINSLKSNFKNYELEADAKIKNNNNKKNNTNKIIFNENANEYSFDSLNKNDQKAFNVSSYNLRKNILKKKKCINQTNIKKKNYNELLQDSGTSKNKFGHYSEHKNEDYLSKVNEKLKLPKNNKERKNMKIIENIENIKEIEKKYKRLKEIEKKEKLKKQLYDLKLKKITKNNNIRILKNRSLKTKKEFFTSLVKKDINGFNTVIKFKINNKTNQNFFLNKKTEQSIFKKELYLMNKKKLENIVDKDSSINSCENLDYTNIGFNNINNINALHKNEDKPILTSIPNESNVSNKRSLSDFNKKDIPNNCFKYSERKSSKNECKAQDKLNIFNKIITENKKYINIEKDKTNILNNNGIHNIKKKNKQNVENIHNLNVDKYVISDIECSNESDNTSVFLKTENISLPPKTIKYKLSDYSEHLKKIKYDTFLNSIENTDCIDSQINDKYIEDIIKMELENYKKLKDYNYVNKKTSQKMKISKKYCQLKKVYENQDQKELQNFLKTQKLNNLNMEEKTKSNIKIQKCDLPSIEKRSCGPDKKFTINTYLSTKEDVKSKENTKLISFQKDCNSYIRRNYSPNNFFIYNTYKTTESISRRKKIDNYAKELRSLASEKKIDRSMKNIKNIGSKIKKINIVKELEKKKNDNMKDREVYRDGYVLLIDKNPK